MGIFQLECGPISIVFLDYSFNFNPPSVPLTQPYVAG